MITEFLLVSFGAFIGWQIFKSLVWFQIPPRFAPIIVLIISFAMTYLSKPSLLVAFAATGGVAGVIRLVDAEGIEPWKMPSFTEIKEAHRLVRSHRRRPQTRTRRTEAGSRIPPLGARQTACRVLP
jgi:hypothetical protein